MTDDDDQVDDAPELTALLREAHLADGDAQLPAAVAARLEATLAELVVQRTADDTGDETSDETGVRDVVPLRRRPGRRWLVAAAAVIAVGAGGVGLNQVLSGSDGDADRLTSADGAASSATSPGEFESCSTCAAGGDTADAPHPSDDLSAFDSPRAPVPSQQLPRLATVPPPFTSADFAAQAERYTRQRSLTAAGTLAPEAGLQDAATQAPATGKDDVRPGTRSSAVSCPGPSDLDAQIVPIRYDGAPAALAVHPLNDGTQLVEAWSCDGGTVLNSTVVER